MLCTALSSQPRLKKPKSEKVVSRSEQRTTPLNAHDPEVIGGDVIKLHPGRHFQGAILILVVPGASYANALLLLNYRWPSSGKRG